MKRLVKHQESDDHQLMRRWVSDKAIERWKHREKFLQELYDMWKKGKQGKYGYLSPIHERKTQEAGRGLSIPPKKLRERKARQNHFWGPPSPPPGLLGDAYPHSSVASLFHDHLNEAPSSSAAAAPRKGTASQSSPAATSPSGPSPDRLRRTSGSDRVYTHKGHHSEKGVTVTVLHNPPMMTSLRPPHDQSFSIFLSPRDISRPRTPPSSAFEDD